jgi:hypothetical protein
MYRRNVARRPCRRSSDNAEFAQTGSGIDLGTALAREQQRGLRHAPGKTFAAHRRAA